MRLGDVPVGQRVLILDREYEVARQGTSGTSVCLITSKEVKGRTFSSKGRPTLFSSECAATLVT